MRHAPIALGVVLACTKPSPNEPQPDRNGSAIEKARPDRMSSIDEARMIESLSDTEAVQHCEEVLAYWSKQPGNPDRRAACLGVALDAVSSTESDPRKTCKAALTKCLSTDPPPPLTCDPSETTFNRHCKGITVGETNACQRAIREIIVARRDICDTLTTGNVDAIRKQLANDLTADPHCQRMRAACGP